MYGAESQINDVNNKFENKTYNTKVDIYIVPKKMDDFYFAHKVEQQLRYEGLFGKYNLTEELLKYIFLHEYNLKVEYNGHNYIAYNNDDTINLIINLVRHYELGFPTNYIDKPTPIAMSDYSTGFNGRGF